MKSAEVSTCSRIKSREKASRRMRRILAWGYCPSVCMIFFLNYCSFRNYLRNRLSDAVSGASHSPFLLPERVVLTLLRLFLPPVFRGHFFYALFNQPAITPSASSMPIFFRLENN